MITALTVRYLTKRYIGEYRSKTDLLYRQVISLDSCLLDVEIVDVSAENENEFPVDQIQWADSCLIVYSITDRNSFKYATRALGNLKSMQSGFSAYLIANKADLDHLREVSKRFGIIGDLCERWNERACFENGKIGLIRRHGIGPVQRKISFLTPHFWRALALGASFSVRVRARNYAQYFICTFSRH